MLAVITHGMIRTRHFDTDDRYHLLCGTCGVCNLSKHHTVYCGSTIVEQACFFMCNVSEPANTM